jgi:enamine deaminase RidA (YjgF/YER057c/UK114 family)
LTICILAASSGILAQRNKKNEEPKTQVLPLPPELPMARAADTESLDFHISPLLLTGGLSAQIRQSLNDLIRDTKGETIIKLRAFVAGAGDARRVQAQAAEIFSDRKLPLPVLSIIQVGALGRERAQVVIEAVVSTRRILNENGLAFFAGQQGASFPAAMERLKRSLEAASVTPEHVLTCTCFTSRLENYEADRAAVQVAFPNTAINLVQALRDPANDSSTCEAVGQLSKRPAVPVVWMKSARATLVNARQLVFTGLQLTFGSFLDDAHEAFARLERAASSVNAIEAPVEVNAFSLDPYSGSALRKSTSVPASTFTIQTVEGLPAMDASAGIEAVLAPNVQSPITAPE